MKRTVVGWRQGRTRRRPSTLDERASCCAAWRSTSGCSTRRCASSRTTCSRRCGAGPAGRSPTRRFRSRLRSRRWTPAASSSALISAWWGPEGELIGNDEVAELGRAHPDRLAGIAAVDLRRPMDAVRELRRCVAELGFKGLRVHAVAVGSAADRPALLPALRRLRRARRPVLHPGRAHRAASSLRDGASDPLHRPGRDRLP